jgi:hypothetical protein
MRRARAAGAEQGASILQHVISVALLLSASESAAAPASPVWLPFRLQQGDGGPGMLVARQGRRHRAGRATCKRDVSIALHLSALESAAAPASPIWWYHRLQRGEEGLGCS